MKRWIVLAMFAALAFAGLPAIAGAMVITTANPVHTGVHARVRLHHHARHLRHARAELSAAHGHVPVSRPIPVPAPLRSRPARSHTAVPHTATKLHPSPTRGGAPYALGPASLSLALGTSDPSMPVAHNELISNPSTGILRGRSPPRGDPPSAIASPHLARALTSRRAPSDPIHSLPVSSTSPFAHALAHAGMRVPCAVLPDGTFAFSLPCFPYTPDRALEGGPAGTHLPSWRCFT